MASSKFAASFTARTTLPDAVVLSGELASKSAYPSTIDNLVAIVAAASWRAFKTIARLSGIEPRRASMGSLPVRTSCLVAWTFH